MQYWMASAMEKASADSFRAHLLPEPVAQAESVRMNLRSPIYRKSRPFQAPFNCIAVMKSWLDTSHPAIHAKPTIDKRGSFSDMNRNY
jgi:hypothetical protein